MVILSMDTQTANTEAQDARFAITVMFDRAEDLRDYPGQYFPALAKADKALAQWREDYPEAGRDEKRSNLLASAESMERQAKGALTYDADGWISPNEQQKRHDEGMVKAANLRTEAEIEAEALRKFNAKWGLS